MFFALKPFQTDLFPVCPFGHKTASSFSLPKDPMFHCIGRISWPSETGTTSRSELTATRCAHKNFQKQSLINHTNPLLTQPMNNKKILCLLPLEFRQMYTLSRHVSNVHFIQACIKCTLYTGMYQMYTLFRLVSNVHFIQACIKCTLYPDMYQMYTLSRHVSNVHFIQACIKCTLYPGMYQMYTLSRHV